MLNWLFSRPLQIKFFVGTILLASTALLLIILNVFQMLNQFLAHHIEDDMQQRSHILAMALTTGPAAHNHDDLQRLLREVSDMHGYCYLSVQDSTGKLLAATGNLPAGETTLAERSNTCFGRTIQLLHDGKPFGTLSYGVNTGFIHVLERSLRTELLTIAALWFAIGTAVFFFLVRRLVKPLQEITRASELMAHGNLNAVMPIDLPQDELGKLARSFSNMAAALRARVESQQSYSHALYVEQARLNALISILPVGIMFVDTARRVQFVNHECRRLWGLSETDDYTGQRDTELISQASDMMEHPDALMQEVDAALKQYGISSHFDTPLRNGRIIRSRSCVVPDAAGDRYIGRIWIYEDVTEERARLQDAQALAARDSLSGLYHRRRFEEDLARSFAQAQRNGQSLSLLYFDLDDFKNINDAHGHAVGDKILKSVAQTLMLQSRRNESLYHMGGDEFAILIADSESHQIEKLAQRVLASIEELQFDVTKPALRLSCSMGIAICTGKMCPEDSLELLRQAEIAMYQAKHFGKHRWHVYDSAQALDLGKDSR
ncbi:MAG: diguanylate cyclase [Sideroxyarcus sp.]|nr:diguanylate cyclase [Sideroxyarcus sp.]